LSEYNKLDVSLWFSSSLIRLELWLNNKFSIESIGTIYEFTSEEEGSICSLVKYWVWLISIEPYFLWSQSLGDVSNVFLNFKFKHILSFYGV